MTDVSRETDPPLDQLEEAYGQTAVQLKAFAELLATVGEERGLIGPREISRLWQRHIFNCAAVAELISKNANVIDVGSGAGLPGLIIAIVRPDLSVELVESMARRVDWLQECMVGIGLTNVVVTRARAEELAGHREADVVTARAVAPLRKLVGWTVPLLRRGGTVLAIKGDRAESEIVESRAELRKAGMSARIRNVRAPLAHEDTTVVELAAARA